MATSEKNRHARKQKEAKTAPAKKAAAKSAAAKKAGAKKSSAKKPAGQAAEAQAPGHEEGLHGAARKAAEFLGMDPGEVEATADKLRSQTRHAGKRVREEMDRLGKRAEVLTTRFDVGMKKGVERVEKLADEVARGLGVDTDDMAAKVEARLDWASKEASRLAAEAEAEAKKMYDQARQRLHEILEKRK